MGESGRANTGGSDASLLYRSLSSGQRATIGALIVAAGSSSRMRGVDKLWADLGGMPLLARTVASFAATPQVDRIVVLTNKDNCERVSRLQAESGLRIDSVVCQGGATRQASVLAGLRSLRYCGVVAVHDGARPLVTTDLIRRGVEAANTTGAAIAAVPVKDTIKRVGSDGLIVETPPRDALWMAQTPQVARRDALERAYAFADERGLAATDEAGLLEAAGFPVAVFAGSYDNLKVTTPEDLAMAAALLSAGP